MAGVARAGRRDAQAVLAALVVAGRAAQPDADRPRLREGAPGDLRLEGVAAGHRRLDNLRAGDLPPPREADLAARLARLAGEEGHLVGGERSEGEDQRGVVLVLPEAARPVEARRGDLTADVERRRVVTDPDREPERRVGGPQDEGVGPRARRPLAEDAVELHLLPLEQEAGLQRRGQRRAASRRVARAQEPPLGERGLANRDVARGLVRRRHSRRRAAGGQQQQRARQERRSVEGERGRGAVGWHAANDSELSARSEREATS